MNDMTTPKPWKDKKAVLKKRYPALTEEDLTYDGDVEELIDRIHRKIGKSRNEVKRLIKRM
ncbi:MAG TPA: hypothetical protein VK112_03535 [Fodinibius sp.]|nr:hypothetical protein [Fodinibius sp.]